MAKLKILINFEFLKWFYIWKEKKNIEKKGGEVLDKRKYHRKKNRQLVSFLHKSRRDNSLTTNDELTIVKQ